MTYRIYSNLVARLDFERVALFKNSKGQYIVGAANNDNDSTHEENLDYESISLGH